MINFYARGERNKKAQYEYVQSELKTIERDLGMIKAQKQALSQFPPHHPKRGISLSRKRFHVDDQVNMKVSWITNSEKSTQFVQNMRRKLKATKTFTPGVRYN